MTPIPIVMSDEQIKQERIRNAAPQLLEALKLFMVDFETGEMSDAMIVRRMSQRTAAAIRAVEREGKGCQ